MADRGATRGEIEAVYRERFRAFLLTATAMLRDGEAALDVVQDAFAVALDQQRTFRREANVEAWIWRIVLNLAHDKQRARHRQAFGPEEAELRDEPTSRHDDLRSRLLALPERQRLTVFLRYYADLSYDEIAAALGVRPGTVAASLNAAHATLRSKLEEEAHR
jgi:RNA polymerase sigma factor (sigma-70 family)